MYDSGVSIANQLSNRARLLRTQRNTQHRKQLEKAERTRKAANPPAVPPEHPPAFQAQLEAQAAVVQGKARRRVAALQLSETLGTLTGARVSHQVRRQGPPVPVAATLRINSEGELWDDKLGRMRKALPSELNAKALADVGVYEPTPLAKVKAKRR